MTSTRTDSKNAASIRRDFIQQAMNRYLNGMLTNEQVIEELLNLAKQIQAAQNEGEQLGLTADELAFYDALTKPQANNRENNSS